MGKNLSVSAAVVFCALVFMWHWLQVSRMQDLSANSLVAESGATARLSISPVADVAVVTITVSDGASAPNSFLSGLFSSGAELLAEHELATHAREGFDLYALLLPYRARIVVVNVAHNVMAPRNVRFSRNLFSNPTAIAPALVAGKYLIALVLFDYTTCYQALSHQDQVDRTIDQFLSEIPMAPEVSKDWFKGVLRTYDYNIGDSKTQNDKAIVTISVTRPDLALWERTVDASLSGETTPDSIAQKNLTENTYPKVTYDDNIVMVNQGGEWRLLVNFPFKENIIKEHKDAVDLYHKHDYVKAIAAYQKILDELDKEQTTGNAGLKYQYGRELADIQKAQKQIPDAQAYIPKIVLSDVDMRMSTSWLPGIFGKMTNSGDKAIDEVQFTVTYTEGNGKNKKQVFSEVHTPIATPLEFTNFGRPVLPFVPGETRNFGFKMTAPPEIQQEARTDLTVTAIVFTQSAATLPKPPTARAEGNAFGPPVPAGQWAVITPPTGFDPKVGLVLLESAPEDQWSVFSPEGTGSSRTLCEAGLKRGIERGRQLYLGHASQGAAVSLRSWEQGSCVKSDGSRRFQTGSRMGLAY